jgi:hypothetical protein
MGTGKVNFKQETSTEVKYWCRQVFKRLVEWCELEPSCLQAGPCYCNEPLNSGTPENYLYKFFKSQRALKRVFIRFIHVNHIWTSRFLQILYISDKRERSNRSNADSWRLIEWYSHFPTIRYITAWLCLLHGPRKHLAPTFISYFVRGCIQKFPDWVDKEIYTYNNKHPLRTNTKGYGGKTH